MSDDYLIYSDTEEIEFSTLDDGVNFDLDNNGFAEKTAWIVNDDGFLVFDVNGNGSVDNGGELFGDQFVKPDGNIALTGFEALTSLDTNKNGKLDIEDAVNDDSVFNHLYVWFDTERNGKTDEGELISISDLGVYISVSSCYCYWLKKKEPERLVSLVLIIAFIFLPAYCDQNATFVNSS